MVKIDAMDPYKAIIGGGPKVGSFTLVTLKGAILN